MSNSSPQTRRTGRAVALAVVALAAGPDVTGVVQAISAEQGVVAFQTITIEQLAQRLEHKDFLFVNVHIPYEGEIARTDLFIPFDQIGQDLSLLPADKAAPIVLYCRSGRMSEIAAGGLAALGYTSVSHVAGGMVEWARSGRPILAK